MSERCRKHEWRLRYLRSADAGDMVTAALHRHSEEFVCCRCGKPGYLKRGWNGRIVAYPAHAIAGVLERAKEWNRRAMR